MKTGLVMNDFFQKELFLRWAERNRPLFSHEPYLLDQGREYITFGFRGVSKHISCYFFKSGNIEMRVYYRRIFHDILTEFDLYEEQTANGRWVCSACRDWPNPNKTEPFVEYEDREELWIKHSFEPLAAWTRKSFTPAARLCLHAYRGSTWAQVEQGEVRKKIKKELGFFKEFHIIDGKE